MAGNLTDLGASDGRGQRRWRLRYRGVSRNFTGTKAEASKALAQHVADVEQGRRRSDDGTVGHALDDYVQATPMAPRSRQDHDRIARTHLAPLRPIRLSALTPARIDRLYRDLLATLAPPTVHRIHTVLHAALERAVRLDRINVNPASRVQPPSAARISTTSVDTATVLKLVAAAQAHGGRLGVMVTLAAATGMRAGELSALQWSQVDTDAGTIVVDRAVDGAGGTKAPKSGRGRTVPLDADSKAVLVAWRAQTGRIAGPVLGDEIGQPWQRPALSLAFTRLCRAEGVVGVRLHDLRHWTGSYLLERGVPATTVAAVLGHSLPTLLRTYARELDRPETLPTLSDARERAERA